LERCVTLHESQPITRHKEDTQNNVFNKNAERQTMLTLQEVLSLAAESPNHQVCLKVHKTS